MRFLRSSTIGLLTFICIFSVSALIYLLTLQVTVMNRDVVKGWLRDSDIYTSNPLGTLLESVPAAPPASGQAAIPTAAVNSALTATFTPQFIQTHTEATIDNAYDWIEGKTDTFKTSIPVNEQRETFIQQLAKSVEPQVAALPVCTNALVISRTACRPATVSVSQLATQLTAESVASSGTLAAPLTLGSSEGISPAPGTFAPDLRFLPTAYTALRTLLPLLPILIILSLLGLIRLHPAATRYGALAKLARRLLLGTLPIFAMALVGYWLLRSNLLDSPGMLPSTSTAALEMFMPLLRLAAGDITLWLMVISGIACALCLGAWIGLHTAHQRTREQAPPESVAPVMSKPSVPTPDQPRP